MSRRLPNKTLSRWWKLLKTCLSVWCSLIGQWRFSNWSSVMMCHLMSWWVLRPSISISRSTNHCSKLFLPRAKTFCLNRQLMVSSLHRRKRGLAHTVRRKWENLWDGRSSSQITGKNGSHCCWRTLEPEGGRLPNWRSHRSNTMKIVSAIISWLRREARAKRKMPQGR